ncbi:MAG TPA: DUF899 domain-containing protein [Caulobacteraceae bacterium]|jgi:predicted dithiol-disulfide oxidoreductase (DUF899 family)|nr:DUF899 domain-containing protein [Caulobacteraceae bacterium]
MSDVAHAPLPPIVSEAEWRAARDALLVKEKALTDALDVLAAERRRLPMMRVEKDYVFDGPEGAVSLADLFDGREQLLLYHFMFGPGAHGWPDAGCPGCSMYMDNIGQFAPTHLAARGVSLALVSLAPLAKIAAYKARMGWPHRWVSSAANTFNADFGMTRPDGEKHAMSVFLRRGGEIYRTWFTAMRGLEGLGDVWRLLDVTPYGRRETWEDSPADWPQSPPYAWWRRHDEYEG